MSTTREAIHPSATVSDNAEIGNDVVIQANVVVHDGAIIGDDCKLEAGAIVYENVRLGAGTFVGAQCILGERQAGYLRDPDYRNPSLEIGLESTIRSGTIIYSGCSMGNGFQTGHRAVIREDSHFGDNCSFGTLSQSDGQIKVGDNCRFHNNVFISTFTTCEDNVHFYPMSCTVDSLHPPCQKGRQGPYVETGVIVGAKVLLLPRVRIGAGSVVAGASVVTGSVEPNSVVVGAPAKVVKKVDEVRCHLEDRPAYQVTLPK